MYFAQVSGKRLWENEDKEIGCTIWLRPLSKYPPFRLDHPRVVVEREDGSLSFTVRMSLDVGELVVVLAYEDVTGTPKDPEPPDEWITFANVIWGTDVLDCAGVPRFALPPSVERVPGMQG